MRAERRGRVAMTASRPRRIAVQPGMLKFAGLTLLLAVLVACGGSADNGEAEPGTEPADPSGAATDVPDALASGETYSFEIPDGSVGKRFTFEVPPGAILTVAASAPQGNASSISFDLGPTGQQARRFDIVPGEEIEPYRYVSSSDGGGTWAIEIAGAEGNRVEFTVNTPLQSDGGVEGDAGSNATASKDVELGVPLSGLLGDEDNEDWYSVPLSGGDVVQVSLDMLTDTGAGGVNAELVFNGQSLANASVFPGSEESLTQIFAEDQTGMAHLRLYGSGTYSFLIDAGPQQDGGREGDAGGDPSAARVAEFGVIEGILGGEDSDDYYRLALPLAAVVTMEVSMVATENVPTRLDVIYNGDSQLFGGVHLAPGQTESLTIVLNNEADEDLFLHLSLGGAYRIDVSAFTQTDGGDDSGDAPDVEDLAKQINAEGSFDGYLNGGNDGRDWYRFTASESGPLQITLGVDSEIGANVNVRVREFGGPEVGQLNTGPGGTSTVTIEVVEGAEYSLHVSTGGQAKYTFTFG